MTGAWTRCRSRHLLVPRPPRSTRAEVRLQFGGPGQHRAPADNLLAVAGRGPALVHAHNSHLQRQRSTVRMGGRRLEWWGAGALVDTHLGDGYGFLATALGTIRHQGVDTPSPDTVEGPLYALPALSEDSCLVDAPRLAASLGAGPPPAARVSPWFGYAPLEPAHLAATDGIVFVKDVPRS